MQEPIKISFTQFIEFTLKQGPPRVNYVKKVKYQEPYHPALDYWKELRDAIKHVHENGLELSYLDSILKTIHSRKLNNYSQAIKQYKKFCDKRSIKWFDVGDSFWSFDDLFVRSTPELGLVIDERPHLVKLYFKEKSEKMDKRNSENALALMKLSTCSKDHKDNVIHSMLNIKKGRLLPLDKKVDDTLRLSLEADAGHFKYLWNRV